MDTASPVIELDHIGYSYPDGKKALSGLSLSVQPAARMGIVGPNGSGKTTLLQIVMGLIRPESGRVVLFGQAMEREKDFVPLRPKLGYVFQHADDQLFCPTVLEDVAFGPLNLGKTPDQARDIARETLDRLGLAGFENRISYRLSGGEKKLVSLATVLAMDPEVLLLDEPTTGLDPDTSARLVAILNDLSKTLVIVSHEYDFLARTTHDFLGMEAGRIAYNGDSSALHTHTHIHPAGAVPHKHVAH